MWVRAIALASSLVGLVGCKQEAPARQGPHTATSKSPATQPKAASDAAPTTAETTIEWMTDEAAALAASKKTRRPLVIDFAAQWCAPCQEMEEKTFPDPELASLISERFLALRVDVTEMNKDQETLMKRYGVKQLPVILVMDADGKELERWTDFVEAAPMRAALDALTR